MTTFAWKNPLIRWIDFRLPVFSYVREHLIVYPTPRNLNVWWNFGSLAGAAFMILLVTGLFLAMFYTAHVDHAFASVERIMRDVDYGWLIRYGHVHGASLFFAVVYVHVFRGLYYGSYKAPREMVWILGVLILFLMVPTAFLGYALVWGQQSFWAATVITSMFTAVPWFGDIMVTYLWGGFSVDNPTLTRFFALHYLMSFVILGIAFIHMWALHTHKSGNPDGIELTPADMVPFHPYYTAKDLAGIGVMMTVFIWFVFFAPNAVTEPDNYIPADPLVTPHLIIPEWYLLPYYTILKAVPHKLLGVVAMVASIAVLFLMPWLDRSPVRSGRYRPLLKGFFWLLVIDCLVLGYLGAKPAEGAYIVIGRIGTVYYFLYFFAVVPLLGMFERRTGGAPTAEGEGT